MKTQNINNTKTHGNSKTVIDLTTGITYNSLREASEAMGVHISAISLVVRGKMKTCKGHRFCFAEENNTAVTEEFTPIKIKAKRGSDTLKKKVKDMTTGEVYESITEAAKALGVHRSAVGYAANGNIKTCKKHVFRFVDDLPTESHHVTNKSMPVYKGKCVLCITTGETYKSVKEAAYVNNLSYASVHAVCYGRCHAVNGLSFCYLEDAPHRVMDIVAGTRKTRANKELAICKEKQATLLNYKAEYEKARAELDAKQAEVLKELEAITKEISDIEFKLN